MRRLLFVLDLHVSIIGMNAVLLMLKMGHSQGNKPWSLLYVSCGDLIA